MLDWNAIILTLLSIGSVRDVIALLGFFPRDKKYSWIIYNNKYDEILLETTLEKFGLTKTEVSKSLSNSKTKKVVNPQIKLISLISKYISMNEECIIYGEVTKVTTKYYINTMEAAHDKKDLALMCDLISTLVSQDDEKRFPDFIITPKIGNPILGEKFAENNNISLILRKNKRDKSRARVNSDSKENHLLINFEGSNRVIKKSKETQKKLYGVIVDCNASGGSEILETIKEFNELIDNLKLNIEKIDKAFILFKADDENDLDENFEQDGLKIKYYFELNEKIKSEIHEAKKSDKELSPYKKRDLKKLKKIYCSLCKDKP